MRNGLDTVCNGFESHRPAIEANFLGTFFWPVIKGLAVFQDGVGCCRMVSASRSAFRPVDVTFPHLFSWCLLFVFLFLTARHPPPPPASADLTPILPSTPPPTAALLAKQEWKDRKKRLQEDIEDDSLNPEKEYLHTTAATVEAQVKKRRKKQGQGCARPTHSHQAGGMEWCGNPFVCLMRKAFDPGQTLESWQWGGVRFAVLFNFKNGTEGSVGKLETDTSHTGKS